MTSQDDSRGANARTITSSDISVKIVTMQQAMLRHKSEFVALATHLRGTQHRLQQQQQQQQEQQTPKSYFDTNHHHHLNPVMEDPFTEPPTSTDAPSQTQHQDSLLLKHIPHMLDLLDHTIQDLHLHLKSLANGAAMEKRRAEGLANLDMWLEGKKQEFREAVQRGLKRVYEAQQYEVVAVGELWRRKWRWVGKLLPALGAWIVEDMQKEAGHGVDGDGEGEFEVEEEGEEGNVDNYVDDEMSD